MDEIEKANDSFHQILLGIMDKGNCKGLSDNTNVSLIRSIIFMSSNLGAREIDKLFKVSYGFNIDSEKNDKIEDIARVGKTSIIKKFSPEFANRIDESITFHPLTPESLLLISKLELEKINNLVSHIFGLKSFKITYDDDVLNFIVDHGTSNQYGSA